MTARPARLPRALGALTLALALPLAACAGTDADAGSAAPPSPSSSAPAEDSSAAAPSSQAPAGQLLEVQVAGGQVTGDTGRVPVAAGEHVVLTVTSDVPDELHLHGYDLTADLQPGTPATVEFDATIPGVFEVELHEAGTVLLSLQVG
ncbi:hypothetical protein [Blastococcus sp. TF02A-30]|uniref:hypothetical protein n=1 Tax=Blastococcus sp. TF02A-30 TaxID=2250580 RepID=UPI000DE95863|nr:hypothetical protein [Blastococcus sp. TF02A-30]RBY89341.1 hypothetical protein DQ241_07615 [Blastococcus sp. TF02A-30]